MRKRKGKPAAEAEPSLSWVNWLKDDVPTVRTRTADNTSASHHMKAVTMRGRAVARQQPSVTGVPNRSLGLKPSVFRGEGERAPTAAGLDQHRAKRKQLHRKSGHHDRAITISLSMPKIRLPKLRIPWTRVGKWALGVGMVAIVIVGTPQLLRYQAQRAKQVAADQKTVTPAYAPLKPSGEGGTVAGAGYDGKRQMYKYDDVYNGVTMTISQQPLPDNLRGNPKDIQKIAESIGAKEKVATTNGDAYISTDDKTATQRVVVAHRQLLIFIQSSRSMTNAEWVSYIQQLQ